MKNFLIVVIASAISVLAVAQECQHSRWGAADEIGNANLITAESVLAASKLIKSGKTYSLGITIDRSTPAFAPRSMALYVLPSRMRLITMTFFMAG